jgi:hypothetical protein
MDLKLFFHLRRKHASSRENSFFSFGSYSQIHSANQHLAPDSIDHDSRLRVDSVGRNIVRAVALHTVISEYS